MRFDEHFVRGALSDISVVHSAFPSEATFSIDTRTLKPGDIFVALKGVNVDGHDYVVQAIEKGAAGIIIAKNKTAVLDSIDKKQRKSLLVLSVADTKNALIRLASAWRAQFVYPVVAITGSVGKTSTKECISHILDLHGMDHVASLGNQNTDIGIALNLLRMRSHHKAAIVEVGISQRGEMVQLAKMVNPTTAVITNIGHSHMEGLGSLNDIALEKRSIFSCFTEESIGIINGDQPILASVGYVHPVIKFGSKMTNQIQARKIHVGNDCLRFVLKIYKIKYPVTIKNVHQGVIFNALAAAAVAHQLNIPDETIVKGISQPVVVAGRFESRALKKHKGILINDCYNANPESMKAALLAFQSIETSADKIAVIGDMLELGLNSPFWHRQVGRFLRKVPSLRHLILVGKLVASTEKTVPVGIKVTVVSTWQEAEKELDAILKNESVLLVKGSHGTGLSNLVEQLSVARGQMQGA